MNPAWRGFAAGALTSTVAAVCAGPAPDSLDATIRRGEVLALQGDQARGLPACASCHDAQRLSLAGRPRNELVARLRAMQASARSSCPALEMSMIAPRLGPAEIEALAAYYAQRQAMP